MSCWPCKALSCVCVYSTPHHCQLCVSHLWQLSGRIDREMRTRHPACSITSLKPEVDIWYSLNHSQGRWAACVFCYCVYFCSHVQQWQDILSCRERVIYGKIPAADWQTTVSQWKSRWFLSRLTATFCWHEEIHNYYVRGSAVYIPAPLLSMILIKQVYY